MITAKTKDIWNKKWRSSTKGMIPKTIWQGPNKKSTAKILSLDRPDLKCLIYTVTGHWNIGKHAQKLGIETSPECKCGISSRDIVPFHFWCDCPNLARLRLEIFNNYFLYEIPKMQEFKIEKLIEYARRSKWF